MSDDDSDLKSSRREPGAVPYSPATQSTHLEDLPAWAHLFSAFPSRKILVVGDMMLDQFIWGKVQRISPEAPVPVVEVERESTQPGGASNVVNNIGALGAQTAMVGIVGDDDHGRTLCEELASAGVNITGVFVEKGGSTTVKTRIVAHSQQVVRVDRERSQPISPEAIEQLAFNAARETEEADAVVISDYAKGVVTHAVVNAIRNAARDRQIPVVANPKPRNLDAVFGITAISMNHPEAEQAVGHTLATWQDILSEGSKLCHRLGVSIVLVTLGSRGLLLFSLDAEPLHVPAAEVPVYDVAGAGDTVISAFALALSAGASPRVAADLANTAAGAVVKKVGVATASEEEILALYRESHARDRRL